MLDAWVLEKFGAPLAERLLRDEVVQQEETTLAWAQKDGLLQFACSHPDQGKPERQWLTDLALVAPRAPGDGVLLVVRNACRFRTQGPVVTSVPRFVRQWAQEMDCRDGGERLSAQAHPVRTAAELDNLLDLLENAKRLLPVLVVTPYSNANPETSAATDPAQLASRLAGMAHVVFLSEAMTYALSDEYGKQGSVFNGAVRCYLPGFRVTDAQTHHLYLPSRNAVDRAAASERAATQAYGFQRFILEQVLGKTPRLSQVHELAKAWLPPLSPR